MPNNWFNTFAPAQSNGFLPNDSSAQSFRFKRSFDWKIIGALLTTRVPGTEAGTEGGVFSGGFTLEILSQDGLETYFQTHVKTKLLFVSLGFLYTWNFLKDEIDTTIIDGKAVTKDTIGPYLLGGTAESEQGDMQPASGEGAIIGEGHILADWFSPIYTLVKGGARPFPVGYKIRITNETWELGPHDNAYSFAFDAASDKPFSHLNYMGAIFSLTRFDGQTYFSSTYEGPILREMFAPIPDCDAPASLWQTETAQVIVAARLRGEASGRGESATKSADRYCLWQSQTQGLEFSPLIYAGKALPEDSPLFGERVSFWEGDDWKNISPCTPNERGGFWSVAEMDGSLFLYGTTSARSPGQIFSIGPSDRMSDD